MRDVVVLDVESSLHNHTVGKFKAHPQHEDNWIVWVGARVFSGTDGSVLKDTSVYRFQDKDCVEVKVPADDPSEFLLVGHNIGFDIHYLCNANNAAREQWIGWLNHPDSLVWDTQLAEYRLSGQSKTSPSLDSCCESRGWATKPGRLKEYWSQGISTEDIPDDEVRPYLRHDINVTSKLFSDQLAQAQEKGMLQLLQIEMKARLATILMEHNGMAFDSGAALRESVEKLEPRFEALQVELLDIGSKLTSLPKVAVLPNSPVWLKSFLYGGWVKWKEQHPMLDDDGNPTYFKSGKKKGEPRMQWREFTAELKPNSPVAWTGTGEDTLSKVVVHKKTDPAVANFLELILEYRDLNKQISTYFKGYSQLTWADGMIHGNLNHTVAATGRLSSSNPNLQNAAHSPIRRHFKSRYENGVLLEIDLSQIEVVAQAVLSQDENMIHDIVNKIDFHSKRAAFAHHADYDFVKEAAKDEAHPDHKVWKQRRKDAKIVSFQKAYGAGVKKISDTTGLSRAEVQQFMDAEDANYPSVPVTQQRWIDTVTASTAIREDRKVSGVLCSPTRAEYRFYQQEFNGHLSYKPTEIKNYPIQGLSADILKIILSGLREVVRSINDSNVFKLPVLIVNTVHDSVVFDIPPGENVEWIARRLLEHFTQHPVNVLKDKFGYTFNCPISADAEAGPNWYDKTGVQA